MPNTTRGVGLFTAENIVAVIRAIPESDGTYRDVASNPKPSSTAANPTMPNFLFTTPAIRAIELGQPPVRRPG